MTCAFCIRPQAFSPSAVVRQVLQWLSAVAAAVCASNERTGDVGKPSISLDAAQTVEDKSTGTYAASVSAMLEMLLAFQSHCREDRLLLTKDVR